MIRKTGVVICMVLAAAMLFLRAVVAQEEPAAGPFDRGEVLSLKEFVETAVKKDTEFEKILIDELTLRYEKDLNLPAGDLIAEVKGQYDFFFSQEREEHEGSVALSKLFPLTGTAIDAEYSTKPGYTSTENTTGFTVEISQPIAQNAFGKATRLKDKIIGVEVDVARHQIVEAYEDYLTAIINGYYDWYEAYESLKVGENSYRENTKLLDNMKERQRSNIALPIDVNKVDLQVLAKKERLIALKDEYAKALTFIENAIRYEGTEDLIPEEPELYREHSVSFKKDFEEFRTTGRTFLVLDLLESKSRLEVDYEADDLLPSIDLFVGYNVTGRDYEIENEDNQFYAGLSLEWPFGHQVDRAEYETAKIALKRTELSNTGTYFRLYKQVKDLSIRINSEQALVNIAKEKIGLAKSILEDETENYSFGKVTLNDYIDAVNVVDTSRYNEILHDSEYKRLMVEWLRITDRLVLKKDVYKK